MKATHWSRDFIDWIHGRFPELNAVPIYLRLAEEVPAITRVPQAMAWTSPALDVRLKPMLQACDQWEGRGIAIMVERIQEFFRLNWSHQLGIIIHELAHGFEKWDSPERHPEFEWSDRDEWYVNNGNIDRLCDAMKVGRITDAEIIVIQHGSTFARSALHCWWRCRHELDLATMHAISDDYRSPEPSQAIESLMNELFEGGNIIDILAKPMPDEFAKLWPDE